MPVYRTYDQAQLDALYNNRAAVPDHGRWMDRWPHASREARAWLGGQLDLPYGPAERQRLDLFPAAGRSAPLLVFIHGGYWRALDKSDFSFAAPAFVEAGIAVAVLGYPLAPAATLDEITESVRLAIGWLFEEAAGFGIDRARLHVSGHSAGGHLTAMALSTDWAARGLPADLVKGGTAISGLYDLEPIRLCYLNQDLHLTPDMARRNSPIELAPNRAGPLILSVGGRETDEFLRQQERYAEAWQGAGLPLQIVPMPDAQHFSIVEAFATPGSPLYQAVSQQILSNV